MSDNLTYTLDEIVERTGFDKRTTSYYVQKGLLPKVGRRGPKTRYPQVFLDRLLFIKLLRDHKVNMVHAGHSHTYTYWDNWHAPLVIGEYDIVVDANRNGIYDASMDGLDGGSPGFVVIDMPSVPVPAS